MSEEDIDSAKITGFLEKKLKQGTGVVNAHIGPW